MSNVKMAPPSRFIYSFVLHQMQALLLQLLLHSQMCQWIINQNTKRSNQLSLNHSPNWKVNMRGVHSKTSSLTTGTLKDLHGLREQRTLTEVGNFQNVPFKQPHTRNQIHMHVYRRGSADTQTVAHNQRLPCTHAVLFKVELNSGAFRGRWVTQTHWCAQRLWLKNGECEWAVGIVFLALSNMLRPVYWNVSCSPPSRLERVSSSLLNTWLRCLSSFSRCVSVSHTS